MAGVPRSIRNRKGLRTGFHDHAALRSTAKKVAELERVFAALVHNRAIARSDAHLGFPSAEIDRTMLHGWLLLMRR